MLHGLSFAPDPLHTFFDLFVLVGILNLSNVQSLNQLVWANLSEIWADQLDAPGR